MTNRIEHMVMGADGNWRMKVVYGLKLDSDALRVATPDLRLRVGWYEDKVGAMSYIIAISPIDPRLARNLLYILDDDRHWK